MNDITTIANAASEVLGEKWDDFVAEHEWDEGRAADALGLWNDFRDMATMDGDTLVRELERGSADGLMGCRVSELVDSIHSF